jgi:hypothetical protein
MVRIYHNADVFKERGAAAVPSLRLLQPWMYSVLFLFLSPSINIQLKGFQAYGRILLAVADLAVVSLHQHTLQSEGRREFVYLRTLSHNVKTHVQNGENLRQMWDSQQRFRNVIVSTNQKLFPWLVCLS